LANLKPLTDGIDNYNYSVNDVAAMNAITSPPAGSTAFITSTKARYYYDGTAWVILYQPWTNYTPVMTTNGSSAITGWDLTDKGRYMVIGKTVFVQVGTSLTATPSAFTAINVSLPIDVLPSTTYNANLIIGEGLFVKGADLYPIKVAHVAASYAKLSYHSESKILPLATTANKNPAAFATGNSIVLNLAYSL